jgi:hypothetical protein
VRAAAARLADAGVRDARQAVLARIEQQLLARAAGEFLARAALVEVGADGGGAAGEGVARALELGEREEGGAGG